MKQRTYIAIDLKSFYASVECRERDLDPLDTNLVVADESRTDKTICLAVTPSLKSYGISGRGRLFEVKQRVKEANAGRQHDAPGHRLDGTSHFYSELQANPYLAIDFIIAPPRMAYYMEYGNRWDRHEPLSLQGGNGHCGETHPRRQERRPNSRTG